VPGLAEVVDRLGLTLAAQGVLVSMLFLSPDLRRRG
jgi:hypothetical protein